MRLTALVAASLALLAVASVARAQVAHLECQASGLQQNLRAEGKAELVGDIFLNCVSSDPGLPAPGESVLVNILVELDVPITNNVNFGAGSDRIDAVLVVNGRNPRLGQLLGDGRTAFWHNVKAPFPGEIDPDTGLPNPDVTQIRIVSLRAHAAALGLPPLGNVRAVTASVAVEPSGAMVLDQSQFGVGFTRRSLTTDVSRLVGEQCVNSPIGAQATITLREGFSSAWKTQGVPSDAKNVFWESGYYAAGSNNGAGASGPTMFQVNFAGVPEGMNLSVPRTVSKTEFGQTVSFTVDGQSCGMEGTAPIFVDQDGNGSALYKVCVTNGSIREEITIPVSASWTADSVARGDVEVFTSYYPLNGSDVASAASPEPRFIPGDQTEFNVIEVRPCYPEFDLTTVQYYDSDRDIYLKARGMGYLAQPLVEEAGDDFSPDWAPNGMRLAFVSRRDGNAEIYVINADKTGLMRLTNNPGEDLEPRWSPDGAKIAFYSNRDGNNNVYVMNADGSGQMALTEDVSDDWGARWSPYGSKIAFRTLRGVGPAKLYVMDADGSNEIFLTNTLIGDVGIPSWSPDGNQLVVADSPQGNFEIFTINANGSEKINRSNNPGNDSQAVWSPDGARIAFRSDRDGNFEIYVMNADGSDQRNVTNYTNGDSLPVWTPDGVGLAIRSERFGFRTIFYVRPDGGPLQDTFLADGVDNFAPPVWRPTPRFPVQPGVYREGEWMLDVDGDGSYSMADDKRFFFGFEGATPFVGDWDGDGRDNVGVYAGGYWFLDYDGNGLYDGLIDKVFPYGWDDPSVKPIVGDWNGDSKTDVGLYVNGIWFLDSNGNQTYDGADKIFGLGGWDGSMPFVGDWDGDGTDSAGIYSFGFWFLDADGDGVFDTNTGDKLYPFGWNDPLVQPQIGDWNGNGKTNVGVYAGGTWFVDSDGDELFTGADKVMSLGWNNPELVPVVGDWNGNGRDTPGVVDGGVWYLETNGDWFFDGNDSVVYWGDDLPSEPQDLRRFLPGRW